MSNRPILVTGAHRSGTTWVGKMVASSKKVVYIHEPFNLFHLEGGIYHGKFSKWFTYINSINAWKYEHALQKTIDKKYDMIKALLRSNNNLNNLKGVIKEGFIYNWARISNKRALVKDPIAIFSTEWLVNTFNMQPIILIRHPAAFVASVNKKNWSHPFSDFLVQPNLINNLISDFRDEIKFFSEHSQDINDQACLLWRIIYYVVHLFQMKYKDWRFIRHEDLSANPIKEFERIFCYLELEFTEKSKKVIYSHSYVNNKSEEKSIIRNSRKNIALWKERLTQKDIDKIYKNTQNISQYFYTDGDW